MEPFWDIDEGFLTKERDKARKIRASQWWKRKCDPGICHYCRKRFGPKELTMDHVIPLALGGKSERFNLVPCCKACNTQKNQLLPWEWEEYMTSIKQ